MLAYGRSDSFWGGSNDQEREQIERKEKERLCSRSVVENGNREREREEDRGI